MSTSDTKTLPPLGVPLGEQLAKLPDGGPLFRVHVLSNQIEAMVLHDVLEDRGIPHVIESYRDTAYDGLFQATRGWGAVVVREEDADRAAALIKTALEELLESAEDEEEEEDEGEP